MIVAVVSARVMLVYATSETPTDCAASMARRWLAKRSATGTEAEISSSFSAPSKAAARLSGSPKSARRTTTPRSARSLIPATSRPVATIRGAAIPRRSNASTASRPNCPVAPVTTMDMDESSFPPRPFRGTRPC